MAGAIKFTAKGDFRKTTGFLQRMQQFAKLSWLDKYGRKGVEALRDATPVDSGRARDSWSYAIERTSDGAELVWYNDDIENGFNVVIGLVYGHATKSGTFVKGHDFVSPAIRGVFDDIADEIRREMS